MSGFMIVSSPMFQTATSVRVQFAARDSEAKTVSVLQINHKYHKCIMHVSIVALANDHDHNIHCIYRLLRAPLTPLHQHN